MIHVGSSGGQRPHLHDLEVPSLHLANRQKFLVNPSVIGCAADERALMDGFVGLTVYTRIVYDRKPNLRADVDLRVSQVTGLSFVYAHNPWQLCA